MFKTLTDKSKAAIFTVIVLLLTVTVAASINLFSTTSEFLSIVLYMFTPALTALIMMLVVTRDGFSREGWKPLGLHRLGLKAWWIAFLLPLVVGVVATALVWATPLASSVVPERGMGTTILGFAITVGLATLTLSLGEELGWRGYLLPRLLGVGRTRALVLVGLIWAAWHVPLIFLTPLYHANGNRLLVLCLFVGTIVAGSFFFGYLRIWTGSVWPASIAHSAHNAAWGTLGAFTVASSPVVVNQYLVGDSGILILIGTVVGAVWLGRKVSKDVSLVQPPLDTGAAQPQVR
jgi:CAAX protease family protein